MKVPNNLKDHQLGPEMGTKSLGLTHIVLPCTVAVENAARNHSNSAQNVCPKKAALISLVENSQLEDILWPKTPLP